MLQASTYPGHEFGKSRSIVNHLRRSFSPPYSLAPDMYNSGNTEANRYEKDKLKRPTTQPELKYPISDYSDIDIKHNLRETFDLNADDDYKELFFAPNYDDYVFGQNYFGMSTENNDLLELEDFVSVDPLGHDTDENVGNIPHAENNMLTYNKSLLIVTNSEDRPRGTKVLEDTENEDDDTDIVHPFVHPDHYQYLNPPKRIKDSIRHEDKHSTHPFTQSPKRESSNNFNSPSKVVYDKGDWTPIFVFPKDIYGQKPYQPFSTHSNKLLSKPIRFPSRSKTVNVNKNVLDTPASHSPLKRIDTLATLNFEQNTRKEQPKGFKFGSVQAVPGSPSYDIQNKHPFSESQREELNWPSHNEIPSNHISKRNETKEVDSPECYRQTCTQLITGRYLKYSQVLQIIQSEEYLDFANIKKRNQIKKLIKEREDKKSRQEKATKGMKGSKTRLKSFSSLVNFPHNRNMFQYLKRILNTRTKASKLKRNISENIGRIHDDTTCSQILTGPGEILSPHYPNNYNISASNMIMYKNCKWVVKGLPEQKVVLEFIDFHLGDDLPDNDDCR